MRRQVWRLAAAALAVLVSSATCETLRHNGGSAPADTAKGPYNLGATPSTKFTPTLGTIGAALLACVCAALANSAGIGGGPFYMPLFNVVLGFDLSSATALSHTVVSISAVGSSLYGLSQPSPHDSRFPLVDLDIAIVFIPALLFGVSWGVLFNVLIPGWLQTILLTALLLYVIKKTAHKGINQWKMEQRQKSKQEPSRLQAHRDGNDEEDELDRGILHEESFHASISKEGAGEQLEEAVQAAAAAVDRDTRSFLQYLRDAWQRLPVIKLLAVIALWALFLVTQQQKARYKRCSPQFFSWFAGQVVFLLAATFIGISYQVRKASSGAEDIDPEMREILLGHEGRGTAGRRALLGKLAGVVVVMAASGACAGLLGIGGALIFNPFLLQLGVHPAVTASTAVLMILFSSSSIALSLAFQGLLNASYAEVFAPLCFVFSLIGVTVVGRIVRKSGHTSIIVLILTGLIIAGTVLTAVFGGLRSIHSIRAGHDIAPRPFCQS